MGDTARETHALGKVSAVFKTEKDGGWEEWEVLEMRVQDPLGYPYSGRLEIVATNRNLDFDYLLGRSCSLVLDRGKRKQLYKGLVIRVRGMGNFDFGSVGRVDFAAALWLLYQGRNIRVFENRTAPQIVEEVVQTALAPFGRRIRLNLGSTYEPLESRTQLKEPDWDFIERLMADEGMFLYFDQGEAEDDPETVVLIDCNDALPEVETEEGEKIEQNERPSMDFATIGQSWRDAHKDRAPSKEAEPEPVSIMVSLQIDPKDPVHADDKFVLRDATGFSCEKTVKDDQGSGNGCLDLQFEGLRRDHRYTLEVRRGGGRAGYKMFQNQTFEDLQSPKPDKDQQ